MRARSAAAIAALICLPLTACGDDSDDKPEAGTPAPSAPAGKNTDGKGETAALEQSVREYTKKLFGGDASGHDLLSKRCQEEMPRVQFAEVAKQGHHEFGAQTIKNIKVEQISGHMARVSYGVGIPQFERKNQPWTREDGTWRWDAC
ncbi:hypothetical protein [Streptomyces sp. NPDC018031]|uniref:hypothetical protein n=1 Tax=Streptomyces sp. NPDC018031 TaxID=3365033 RepID=UPI003787E1B3